MSEETSDTQAVIDTAVMAAEPKALDNATALYTVVTPIGSTLQVIDTEAHRRRHMDRPARKQGTVQLTNPASLTQYMVEHAIAGTEMYADWRAREVVAVLNDHNETNPGWGDHRAVLSLVATPEWERWVNLDNKYLTQEVFAEHILDTTADVVAPDAADLLEMAETFGATKSVAFKSGSRLRDGQRQLTYVETIDAQAGPAGNVTIPASILLLLAPFDGAERVEMTARIRYRINEGDLRIGYVLDRPDLVLRTAFAGVIGEVEAATGVTALWGTPRS